MSFIVCGLGRVFANVGRPSSRSKYRLSCGYVVFHGMLGHRRETQPSILPRAMSARVNLLSMRNSLPSSTKVARALRPPSAFLICLRNESVRQGCVVGRSESARVQTHLAFHGSLCFSCSRCPSKRAITSASQMLSERTSTFLANNRSSTSSGSNDGLGYLASSHSRM